MKDLSGKVGFITGGVSGIGLGIARAFLSAGMNVVLTYRREHHLKEAQEALAEHAGRVRMLQVDVADRVAMRTAAEEAERAFGKVHVLCNNAGVGVRTSIRDATYGDWDWAISVNIMGVVNGIQCLLPKIRAHGEGGHIVTTASMSGLAVPQVAGLYSATKCATVAMMEALRGELSSERIGVSVFCPGLVRTNIAETEDARPVQHGAGRGVMDPRAREWFRQTVVAHGMDPVEAGNYVLDGIRHNDLYILSHPEFEPVVRERFEAILGSFPLERSVPQSRLRAEALTLSNPTYSRERERRRCREELASPSQ
jgi:NAD(P)-dependent dehydrogenase (short-subunit alcohol dehydrogenase family)